MYFMNCTPHAVTIYAEDGKTVLVELPPEKVAVRVQTPPQRPVEPVIIDGKSIPVVTAQDFSGGQVTGLPPCDEFQEPHTALIVGIIGSAEVARKWGGPVYVTDTGPDSVVRDASGRILGVKRLQLAR